jgi:hypothetical protein
MSAALTDLFAPKQTMLPSVRRRESAALSRWAVLLSGLTMFAVGCGSPATAETGSALVAGLPKCDPSLLHPRITIATTATLPGKLIVYVDGVMACLDDASRVDQIVSQIEGRSK